MFNEWNTGTCERSVYGNEWIFVEEGLTTGRNILRIGYWRKDRIMNRILEEGSCNE